MKKLINLKAILLSLSVALILSGCKKEAKDETVTIVPTPIATPMVIGDWELYKSEKQELILSSQNGQIVQSMEWRDNTPPNPQHLTLTFFQDKTFQDFYQGVLVGQGQWEGVSNIETQYNFTFSSSSWSPLQETYTAQFYCDNTMSVKWRIAPPAGNHNFQDAEWYVVYYYKTPGSLPCDDLVDYYVN